MPAAWLAVHVTHAAGSCQAETVQTPAPPGLAHRGRYPVRLGQVGRLGRRALVGRHWVQGRQLRRSRVLRGTPGSRRHTAHAAGPAPGRAVCGRACASPAHLQRGGFKSCRQAELRAKGAVQTAVPAGTPPLAAGAQRGSAQGGSAPSAGTARRWAPPHPVPEPHAPAARQLAQWALCQANPHLPATGSLQCAGCSLLAAPTLHQGLCDKQLAAQSGARQQSGAVGWQSVCLPARQGRAHLAVRYAKHVRVGWRQVGHVRV